MEDNSLIPYNHHQESDGFFLFTTDNDIEYLVFFEKKIQNIFQILYPNIANRFLEFGFIPTDIKISEVNQYPSDERILITVVNILKEYFVHNKNAIIYNCLTIDGKQKARARYFEAIFKRAKQNEILKFDSIIDSENDIQYFQSLLIKNNNPDLEDMVQAFYNIASLLSE